MNKQGAKSAMLFYNSVIGIIHQRQGIHARAIGINYLLGNFESTSTVEFPNQNEANLIECLELIYADSRGKIKNYISQNCSSFKNVQHTNTPDYFRDDEGVIKLFCKLKNAPYKKQYTLTYFAELIDN